MHSEETFQAFMRLPYVSRAPTLDYPTTLGLSEIKCVEALSEPAIYGRKQIASLGSPALVAPKPRYRMSSPAAQC
jgi:hypothetical protein